MQLQRAIGNQALQRIIGDSLDDQRGALPTSTIRRAPDEAETVIPAESGDGTQKEAPFPTAVLTVTGAGAFKGSSRIPGHEGKIEAQSVSLSQNRSSSTTAGVGESGRREPPTMRIAITKYLDDSSGDFVNADSSSHPITLLIEWIRKEKDGAVKTIATRKFSDGIVDGYSVSSGGDKPIESIEMTFRKDGS
jgi:type VI secretion system secreted protein Hcp